MVLPAGGIRDAAGNGMVEYSFTFSTGSSVGGNLPPEVTSYSASTYPAMPGQSVTLTAAATDPDGDSVEYRFDFGDGSASTPWSSTPSAVHSYPEEGHYQTTVQVRDPSGSLSTRRLTVTVVVPPAGPRPSASGPLLCDETGRRLWTVNPDNDTLTAVDIDTLAVLFEVSTCDDPRSVAAASGARFG